VVAATVTTTTEPLPRERLPSHARGLCWKVFPGDSEQAIAAGFTAYAPMEHCVKPADHVERGDPDHTWGRLGEPHA
jgi:hypothetical protein